MVFSNGCRGFLQGLPWFFLRVAVVLYKGCRGFLHYGETKSTPSLSNSGWVRTLKTERRTTICDLWTVSAAEKKLTFLYNYQNKGPEGIKPSAILKQKLFLCFGNEASRGRSVGRFRRKFQKSLFSNTFPAEGYSRVVKIMVPRYSWYFGRFQKFRKYIN